VNFKGVIFDLDGTLLDTLADIGNSMNFVLERHGFPTHYLDSYKLYVGDGAEILVRRSIPKDRRNKKEIDKYLNEYREEYNRNWNKMTRPYDGIPETLNELELRGIRLSVLSNKSQDFAEEIVAAFLPGIKFEQVIGYRTGIPAKPDPHSTLEVAKAMNLGVEQILYAGDTDVDMQTAVNAGMYGVGVLWGFRTGEELKKNGAKKLISHPYEILKMIV
jgi:phosphoglycolate phosphatase